MAYAHHEQLPQNLTLHVGDEETLLARPDHSTDTVELVLAPVELHRRNIQRRLRESQTPKDGLELFDPTEIGRQLLNTLDLPTTTIDRIDRLSLIRSVLSTDDWAGTTARAVPEEPQTIEQIRTEVENVTGFHPERIAAFRAVADRLAAPIDADAIEILDSAVSIERALRRRTEKAISDVEFIRRGARQLLATNGDIWDETYPEVGRVSLVGVSSIPAAHIDLLHAILDTTSVLVDVHFRRPTGSFLACRVSELLDVASPGTVVFES